VPGKVTQTPGGVARNIASAACQLAQGVALASVLGQDAAGSYLLSTLQQTGTLDVSHVKQVQGASTPTVAIVFDNTAEVAACVADVATVEEQLTPGCSLVQQLCAHVIPQARLLVVECNLPAETMRTLSAAASHAGVPVFVEPVSVPKAVRAAPSLQHVDWIKPNAGELQSIADAVCSSQGRPLPPRISRGEDGSGSRSPAAVEGHLRQLAQCAAVLLREGCKRVVVSLGAQGAALFVSGGSSSGSSAARVCVGHLPALPAKIVSLSGAGDTMVGGLVAALLNSGAAGKAAQSQQLPSDADCAALACGMAAAKCSVESLDNVPLTLASAPSLKADAAATLQGLRRHVFSV